MSATPYKGESAYLKERLSRKTRTLSLNASDGIESKAFNATIEHALDLQSRGCKRNTRGDFIHDTYVTFKELLKNLPLNIALNIEISKCHHLRHDFTAKLSKTGRISHALGGDN